VAIISLEQVAPIPYHELANEFKLYKNADIFWVQEEHKNQGAWNYIEPRIENLLNILGGESFRINYVGRKSSSTSGTGYYDVHEKELIKFLGEAFS
jgi:2-oxoglutarate dehydrogenase complex dehydrogenase (E1) component-like enzyme